MAKVHQFPVRIYYEDTDFSGNVYHASYLKFLERGRTEFLRERGISHSALVAIDMAFVVRHIDVVFDRPAHVDDLLLVETEISRIGGARLVIKQETKRDELVLVRAKVTIALVNGRGRPLRIPGDLLKKLK